jgi:hypothetical protein
MSLRTTSADKRKTPKQPPKTSSSTNSSAQYNCGGVGSCFSFEPDTRFRQFDWKVIQPVEWRTESWDFKASTCISGPGGSGPSCGKSVISRAIRKRRAAAGYSRAGPGSFSGGRSAVGNSRREVISDDRRQSQRLLRPTVKLGKPLGKPHSLLR